ncbi:MAG: M28 family peptidase [Candidatus Limnocylindria bacterium]
MDRSCRATAVVLLLVLGGCAAVQLPSPAAPDVPRASSVAEQAFHADPDRILERLEALQAIADEHGGIRFAGTPGYEASVDYAAGELRALGFEVATPEVEFRGFSELPGAELRVGDRTFEAPDDLHALIYSPGGEVTGPVAVLADSGCEPGDFDRVEAGSVVLTTRGGCLRRQQAINAADAGAAALVVGYPDRGPGEIFRPTLIDPGGITIPVISVTDAAVRALQDAAGDPVRLAVATEREPATLRNVIADMGDGPTLIVLGGHLDSVLEGPGINDNGSGVAALLEVARGLAAGGVPEGATVRIGLWGGEELGTVGSTAHVEALEVEPIAYLNLDMAGSINGANLVYDEATAAEGSATITAAFERWFASEGEPTDRVDLGGSSDQYPFAAAGIPTGGLFAGATESGTAARPESSAGSAGPADRCYHLGCDDLDNVDLERVALFAEATFAVAHELLVNH